MVVIGASFQGSGVWFGAKEVDLGKFLVERRFGISVFKLSPSQLETKAQLVLVEQTIKVAAEGFGQNPLNEVFRQDVTNHVLGAAELYLVYAGRECVAFGAIENSKIEGIPVLYLGGLIVKRTFQGNGLMKDLISLEIALSRPRILIARTQNPCILDLIKGFCCEDKFYPLAGSPEGDCRVVVDFLSASKGGFDSENLIGTGTYGRCLYGDGVPKSRRQDSNLFMERINPERGDSVLFIGEVNYEKR